LPEEKKISKTRMKIEKDYETFFSNFVSHLQKKQE
jgi:hypothetical protein